MIIDSHQHFWKYDAIRDHWIDDTMQVIRRDFLPKDLEPILAKNHIDGCIAVQASQSEMETLFLLQCAEENSFIKGVVGWVDLRADHVEDRLNNFIENPYFKGVRHIIQAEKKGFMNRSDFQNGISKLQKLDLTYDILIQHTQINETIEFVEKFPEQKFVLDHIGKPEISKEVSKEWSKAMKILGGHKNIYCKLSGMVTETKNFSWEKKDFLPFIEATLNAFGAERILFGSDWPVCTVAASYEQTHEIVQEYIDQLSHNEKQCIMGLNAQKAYNLKH